MMNQKIRISFIAHSFKGNEGYFFDKNYCTPTFIKEVSFEEVGDNLEEGMVAVYFHNQFTFVLNTVSEKERLLKQLNELLNSMTEEETFSTDIYSIFGQLITLEGKPLEEDFFFSAKDKLQVIRESSAVVKSNIFFRFLSFFWSKKGIHRRKVMVVTKSFCNSFNAPGFSYENSIRDAKFKIFRVQREEKKYMLKNSKAGRFAPFTMDMKKAIDLSPKAHDFQIPELRDEQNRIVTEESYRDVKKESIRYSAINPAKVIRHNPFVVSVYSHSLDCVVILNFPQKLGERLQGKYRVNQKLLAVNSYMQVAESGYVNEGDIEIDLIEGERSNGFWKNVLPLVADFITHDKDQYIVNYFKNEILKQEEWDRLNEKTSAYFKKFPAGCRLGFLIYHRYPTLAFLKEYYPERLKEKS
ncbi:MAG: hypothetical protein ACPG5P_00345 [Saprospiraceae bacterium]